MTGGTSGKLWQAESPGGPVVVKLGRSPAAAAREAAGLTAFASGGAALPVVRVAGAVLVAGRAVPGVTLRARGEDPGDVVADLLRQTWSVAPTGSGMPVPDVLEELGRKLRRLGRHDLAGTARSGSARRARQHLLHGDLHASNILEHAERWIVIDPRTATGPLEADVAVWAVKSGAEDISGAARRVARTLSLDEDLTGMLVERFAVVEADGWRRMGWTGLDGYAGVVAAAEGCW